MYYSGGSYGYNYGYGNPCCGYVNPCGGYGTGGGYPGYGCGGGLGSNTAIILVIFVLLVIVIGARAPRVV
jgi:hypothetical protein